MDLFLILFSVGILVLVLILLSTILSEKADKNTPSVLHQIAKENKLNLDKVESCASLLLGLDENSRKFLAIEPKNHEDPIFIDLREYAQCKLTVRESDQKPGVIRFISLNLIPEKSKNRPVEVVFYDETDLEKRNRKSQMQMAKRWSRYLDRLIAGV